MTSTGFIWLDSGIPGTITDFKNDARFLPTTLPRRNVALGGEEYGMSWEKIVFQSAELLHAQHGENLDQDLSRIDAFYAFHDIFQFCAFTELEFLNLLERQLEPIRHAGSSQDAAPVISVGELNRNNTLLEKHIWQLDLTLSIIERRGGPLWPSAREPANFAKAETARKQLEDDFNHLGSRAKHIQERYQFEIFNDSFREMAKSGTEDNKPSMVLLYTAVLVFTSTFFSMNFKELQNLSIWVYFVVATPLGIGVATLLFFWDRLKVPKTKRNQTRKEDTRDSQKRGLESDIEKGGRFHQHRRSRWIIRIMRALQV